MMYGCPGMERDFRLIFLAERRRRSIRYTVASCAAVALTGAAVFFLWCFT